VSGAGIKEHGAPGPRAHLLFQTVVPADVPAVRTKVASSADRSRIIWQVLQLH
jgi:hypothetical protein